MYWIGVIITICSGLIGIEYVRTRILVRLSALSPRRIDILAMMLLLIGVTIASIEYLSDQRELRIITKGVENLNLQELADYSVFGHKSAAQNGIPLVRTPLNNWCESFVSRDQGILSWKCDEKSDRICRDALKKVSRFPYAHFFLAVSLKERGDLSWRNEATIALKVFEGTTALARHSPDHDYFLSATQKLLRDQK